MGQSELIFWFRETGQTGCRWFQKADRSHAKLLPIWCDIYIWRYRGLYLEITLSKLPALQMWTDNSWNRKANNMVLWSALEYFNEWGKQRSIASKPHFVTTNVEHDAVKLPLKHYEAKQWAGILLQNWMTVPSSNHHPIFTTRRIIHSRILKEWSGHDRRHY